MGKIKFLHLSDLHFGDRNQREVFSQTKSILFEDIEFIIKKLESLEIVFFTGDLVQKGSKIEFEQLEKFLIELWELFKKHGQDPYLICVPGNHDLERSNDLNDPILKILNRWIEDNIKQDHFWNSPNQYIEFVNNRFSNYLDWYQNTSIRKPENITQGYINGDFYCTINHNDLKIGIVGLNSAFLHLTDGSAEKKLGIYNKQIYNLFEDNYIEWLKSNNLSFLLTHHSSDWFEQESLREFHHDIYTDSSYVEHLCGHMHGPSCTNFSINGYPSKRISIAPSLFGLESYNDNPDLKRIHGYTAGIYNINSEEITKTIWPRISKIAIIGGLKIIQNDEFHLDKDSLSFKEKIKDYTISKKEEINSIEKFEDKGGNLFGTSSLQDNRLARTFYKIDQSHMAIRVNERRDAISSLNSQRQCWIVTKFGLGQDEFIGSILNESNINSGNCFRINCEEASSIEELLDSFKISFSKNITEFFEIINTLDSPLIVLNSISDVLVTEASKLKEFTQTIFDYSPKLKTVITSATKPDPYIYESIDLIPLDIPAVKNFIERSQDINSSFTFLEFEKIHRLTSGIPLYLNKVIEQLKFRPLSDLGEGEFESSTSGDFDNILAKTIRKEIDLLKAENSKQSNRRFLLLSVLSLLHNGETYDRIKRFDSTKPFHSDDISFLLKNELVETIQVNSIFDQNQIDSDLIKIIKVPRIIRDYVSSILSNEEKLEIYKQVCAIYLGEDWRNSIKLIQPKDAELELIVYQNMQVSIRFILSYGIEQNKELEIERMTRISTSLISQLSDKGAYKDAISLIEETLLLIKDIDIEGFDKKRVFLTTKLGKNLRMTSFNEKSIDILKEICDDINTSLSLNERNDIRLSIAYAFETLGKKEDALKYADLIKKHEKNKNSNLYLSAESVVIHFIEDEEEKLNKLISLNNKADKFGFKTLNANIILEISRIKKEISQIKQLDKIINTSTNDIYNKVRAFAAKAEIILGSKSNDEITKEDLLGLNIAYSYSFYQRLMTILNKCHRLAWQYWLDQNGYDQLLNLFRYSSFVWRLCGEYKQEQTYINQLHSNEKFIEWFKSNKTGINSTYYEQRIFSLYNNERNKN